MNDSKMNQYLARVTALSAKRASVVSDCTLGFLLT